MDLKDRFSEIIFSVDMLPEMDTDSHEVEEFLQEATLPNLTKDLADGKLFSALMCHILKQENRDFHIKMCALLTNSAVKSINEDKPSKDDMSALSLVANILWADGQERSLMGVLGFIGRLCVEYDMKVPVYLTSIISDNNVVQGFAKYDPYKILEGVESL